MNLLNLLRTQILVLILSYVLSYERKPCTRSIRPQFQWEDIRCYIPPLKPSLLLSSASFLMSHDAATGYINRASLSGGGIIASYGKNQVGTAYEQLQNGARALDLRPKYLTNGTVIFHHGMVNIPVTLNQLLSDVIQWCNENDDELVLLLSSELGYESYIDEYSDDLVAIEAIQSIYSEMGVAYFHCNDVYGLTVEETMQIAELSSGGYLLALDGQVRGSVN